MRQRHRAIRATKRTGRTRIVAIIGGAILAAGLTFVTGSAFADTLPGSVEGPPPAGVPDGSAPLYCPDGPGSVCFTEPPAQGIAVDGAAQGIAAN